MAPLTDDQREVLDPFIAGQAPDGRGEIDIYCPVHADSRRSASINVEKGVWYCHAGCGGGSIRQLVAAADSFVPADGRVAEATRPSNGRMSELVLPTMREVVHWHKRLRRERVIAARLYQQRGIREDTMRKAMIGWDGKTYKIPVFGPDRCLWNVRNYDMRPTMGRSKIWNTRGMGEARLYPYGVLTSTTMSEQVLFCEGEWDTLLALQHGYSAVTRTDGAGKPWNHDWTEHFAGLRVYLCGDADDAGVKSNEEIGYCLSDVAEVYQCHLPYHHRRTNGNDLTDYLFEFHEEDRDAMLLDLIESSARR